MYRYHIELNTNSEIEEFSDIGSTIPPEVMLKGEDEHGSAWTLSAKSLLCSVVMSAKLKKHRKHTAHEVNWDTVCVECEEDIYSLISKFVKECNHGKIN